MKAVGEIARTVAREMLEEIDAQIAGDPDKGAGRDPAGQSPQQIVAGDEPEQQADRRP